MRGMIASRQARVGGKMGKLTGTNHGDAANSLFAFYREKAAELEAASQYYLAAIALAFATESALLAYLLVEFGAENGGELEIPDSINFSELIAELEAIEALSAPIDTPSHIYEDKNVAPKHVAKNVVQNIRQFRNLIHPGRALARSFDPASFTYEDLKEYKEMYDSIMHSLMYYL
jgi:hypothetical protein